MKSWLLLSVASTLVLCGSEIAAGQNGTVSVTLHGMVADPAQSAVPRADVVVYREGVTVAHVQTSASGEFTFQAPPREYQVVVRATGFAELRSTPIPFKPGSTSRFTLQTDRSAGSEASVAAPGSQSPSGQPSYSGESLLQGPVHEVANAKPLELGMFAEGGLGVTDNRSGYKFFEVGAHAGKILTPELGTGLLRGNFEYAIDVIPYWGAYTPKVQKVSCNADPGAAPGTYPCSDVYTVGGTFTGVSVTPITLRWNFTHGRRWMPWLQGAGGLVWTNHKFPAIGNTNRQDLPSNGIHGDTSVWNFTPQFGVGSHLFVREKRSIDFAANAVHISSASLGDKNPGVNASVVFSVGYTWWK